MRLISINSGQRTGYSPTTSKTSKTSNTKASPNPMLDDIKKTLWATADKLRANMDAAEYKHLVLGPMALT